MTHEIEGSHALISAQFARRYGESQGVVHAVEAHHYEVQPQTVEAVLLISADAISASRPGARGESLEHYIKRLESLEQLAASKPGVEKVYALQAGREIRVIVRPTEVDDDLAALLSHEIAREIEDQLEYPGQVKVTVIRESRSVDIARNHANVQNGDIESRGLDAPLGGVAIDRVPRDGLPIEVAPIDDVSLGDISLGDSPIQAA
jgi:ribonuclease Y